MDKISIKKDELVFVAEAETEDEREKMSKMTGTEIFNTASHIEPIGPTVEVWDGVQRFNKLYPHLPNLSLNNVKILVIMKNEQDKKKALSEMLYKNQLDPKTMAQNIVENQINTCAMCSTKFSGIGYAPTPIIDNSHGKRCCPTCYETKIVPCRQKQFLKSKLQKKRTHGRHRRTCRQCQRIETKEFPLLTCVSCKKAYYCDRNCQKADWIVHKQHCAS